MCFNRMAQVFTANIQPTVVRTPCVTDAVGSALRNAYGRDGAVPDDITLLLRQLNSSGGSRPR